MSELISKMSDEELKYEILYRYGEDTSWQEKCLNKLIEKKQADAFAEGVQHYAEHYVE